MAERKIPTAVQAVLQTLQNNGYEAVLVGGCVRDMLLMRPVHDYDVATNAIPAEVVRIFDRTRGTGIKHGTVTIVSDPECPVEVTTYRSETGYSDGRHPDSVVFGATLEDDLSRRDFTINAMALTPTGQIVDPFGGQGDLASKRIRAVGIPTERFQEDSLRILRAVRFAAQLSFGIETITFQAMTETKRGLKRVSRERIGQEFAKIARASWWGVMPLLASGGFLSALEEPLPDLQLHFEHLASIPKERQENWNATFSKTSTHTRWLASWGTWLLYDKSPEQTAKKLFLRLAVGKKDMQAVGSIASIAREEIALWPKSRWREVLFQKGLVPVQIAAKIRDGFALNHQVNYDKLCSLFAAEQPIWSRKDLSVTAAQLMALGLAGERIGQAFELLCNAVLSGESNNTKTNLIKYLKKSLAEGRV
jgi:tRNA nucleotidyltransferase (CCA-adding enzyme)